jgi:putative flippase GtrA
MMTQIEPQKFFNTNKKSILSFLIVGGLSALINLFSFIVLWEVIDINYQLAVSISFVLSVIFHFMANRRFTFNSHGAHFFNHVTKYLVMVALNYTITMIVVHAAVEILQLSPYIGICLAIGTTVCSGYLISRFWVFQPKEV